MPELDTPPAPSAVAAPAAPTPPAATPPAAPTPAPASMIAPKPEGFTPDKIPEKYRVMKGDGTLDIEASTLKLSEGYGHLHKRMVSGEGPPEAPEKYTLQGLPETVDVKALREDPTMQGFLKAAHAKGMNDAQVSWAVSEYLQRADVLARGGLELNIENGTKAIRTVWKDEAAFDNGMALADRAINAYIEKAGLKPEDVHGPMVVEVDGQQLVFPPLANHPAFARLMAAIGPELGEDVPPRGMPVVPANWQDQVNEIRANPAYMDSTHAQHHILRKKMGDLYAMRYPEQAA